MKYLRIVIRAIGIILVNILIIFCLYYLLYFALAYFFKIKDFKINEQINFISVIVIPFSVSIVAYFIDKFRGFILFNELKVSFKMEEPYVTLCDLTLTDSETKGRKVVGRAHCIKLLVENTGFGVAKNCYVVIHQRSCEGTIDKTFQPLSLAWTNWKSMYHDVRHRAVGVFVDLIRLDHGSGKWPKICFHTDTQDCKSEQIIPGSQDSLITPKESCKFKITVYSENTQPVTKNVSFRWNGEWDDAFKNIFELTVE
ncbi:MAG: hypothetical protein ABIC68_06785 [Candidatus Omnitrophota bacterium]